MTRLLILAIILSVVSYASAQFVDTLNTPIGPVTQGAKVAVSWTLLAGVDASTATGDLSATDSATKNVIPVDPAVPLAPKTYMWNVQVPPGTYVLGLNDGSGLKQSGEVVVKAPAGGAAPVPAPAPAPGAPPAKGAPAPAPAPADGKTAAPPAKGAPAPPPSATGGSPSTPSTPSTGGDASSSTTPAAISTGSASSIFPGFDVVLSLLSVAVAMLQF